MAQASGKASKKTARVRRAVVKPTRKAASKPASKPKRAARRLVVAKTPVRRPRRTQPAPAPVQVQVQTPEQVFEFCSQVLQRTQARYSNPQNRELIDECLKIVGLGLSALGSAENYAQQVKYLMARIDSSKEPNHPNYAPPSEPPAAMTDLQRIDPTTSGTTNAR